MNEQQTVTIESATQQIQAEQQAAVTVLTGTTQKALLTSHGASLVTKIEAIDISELETESEQQQAEIVAHADRLRQENDSIGSNQKQVIDANEFISEINQSSVSAGASISQAEQQQYSLLATATNEHQSAIDEQAQQHKTLTLFFV